ncbi:NAD(P)-dependent oxidoreductase [Candidatus Pelagibacter ubique]|jgi:nucleoside-diphosphate-sugar epimerase|nr:NAD(P)-dependent oxidoreductase [Candidatus Pelagibacter ubique]
MKTILIFGGYGFVGNELYNYLITRKFKVYRYTSQKKEIKNKCIKYTLNNFKKLIIKIKPDCIFFLSGNSYPLFSKNNHLLDIKKNNSILQNFLEAAKQSNFSGKIIYSSSIGVYGSINSKKVKESYKKLNPESYYALSKINAEQQCLFYSNNFKLNIIVLRLCSIFGPGLKRQVIFDLIKRILSKDKIIKMRGTMNDAREMMCVKDLVKILLLIIRSKVNSGIYNIGTNKKIKILDIINYLNTKQKTKKKIIFTNEFKFPNFAKLDVIKINKILKKSFKFNFFKDLDKTLDFWRNKRL